MKKIVLIVTMILALSVTYGQENGKRGSFGFKAGIAIASLDGGVDGYSQPHTGVTVGFYYEYMMGRKTSLGIDLLYSGQGVRERGEEYDWIDRLDLHYIILPVTFNYYIVKGLAVKVGIQPGVLAAAVAVEKGEHGTSRDKMGEDCRRFDLSIPMGISYDYRKLRIEMRYNLGLLPFDKDNEGGIQNNWNSVLAITLGYKF